MSKILEQSYTARNAHVEATTLRVRLDPATRAIEFWVGEQKRRDHPRLAKIGPKDASAFVARLTREMGNAVP